jgi:hypothetical protein
MKESSLSQIPSTILVREHLALRALGVRSFDERQHIILLAYMRAHDFEAWVKARADLSVGELMRIEGERGTQERQSNGKCAFWRALDKSKGAS